MEAMAGAGGSRGEGKGEEEHLRKLASHPSPPQPLRGDLDSLHLGQWRLILGGAGKEEGGKNQGTEGARWQSGRWGAITALSW